MKETVLIQLINSQQLRKNGLSSETVARYGEILQDGGSLQPPVVYPDGMGKFLCADGNHTVEAHRLNGATEIVVDVQAGGPREALLYAAGANAHHGLPRSNEDRRNAVRAVLAEEDLRSYSDTQLAKICKVSHTLVAQVRKELQEAGVPMPESRLMVRSGKTIAFTPSSGTQAGKTVPATKDTLKRPDAQGAVPIAADIVCQQDAAASQALAKALASESAGVCAADDDLPRPVTGAEAVAAALSGRGSLVVLWRHSTEDEKQEFCLWLKNTCDNCSECLMKARAV